MDQKLVLYHSLKKSINLYHVKPCFNKRFICPDYIKDFEAMNFITVVTKIGILLCGLYFIPKCEGKPIKRSVTEMQFMHNYGDFRHFMQRQEWLQLKLQNLYPASVSTPQESTPKVAETRPQKPHKKENTMENRTKNHHQNHRTSQKKPHGHSGKPKPDKMLQPMKET